MVVVRDVKEFAKKNEAHLKRFLRYKTGIIDRDIISDHIQEFYVRLIQTGALDSYCEEKGSFNVYIFTLLCWSVAVVAKKYKKEKTLLISHVKNRRHNCEEDIWDYVSKNYGFYKISGREYTELFEYDFDYDLDKYIDNFREYICEKEQGNRAKQMVIFINNKKDGYKSTDIASMLNVSDNMVKIIKQRVKKRYNEWKKKTVTF
jgi:DNA-directed RNA polymerase specialized sigma24 family protein